MKNLRPVKSKEEIVAGIPYLQVAVWVCGTMHLHSHCFHGQPFKLPTGWWIRVVSKKELRKMDNLEQIFEGSRSLSGAGLDTPYSTHHRTFRFNTRNAKVLQDLVARQALREYLTMIGVKDIGGAFALMRQKSHSMGVMPSSALN